MIIIVFFWPALSSVHINISAILCTTEQFAGKTANNEKRFNSQEWHACFYIPTGVELCCTANQPFGPLIQIPFVKSPSLNTQLKNQDVMIHISHLIHLKYSSNSIQICNKEIPSRHPLGHRIHKDTSHCSQFSTCFLWWFHFLWYNQNHLHLLMLLIA